ncbi:MAG: antitoxin Xre/MbcA/ParS toxin-binding domain-containing protein [Methylocystis sp.]
MADLAPDAHAGPGSSRIPAELEAFFSMAERWHLSTDEQIILLGSPGRSTFFKWKKEGGSIPPDTTERLSHMLGIWKSLRILFTIDERGDEWMRKPNEYFDGLSALEVMLSGKFIDLYKVRSYLDAQRGG